MDMGYEVRVTLRTGNAGSSDGSDASATGA